MDLRATNTSRQKSRIQHFYLHGYTTESLQMHAIQRHALSSHHTLDRVDGGLFSYRQIPTAVLYVFENWLKKSWTFVEWHSVYSSFMRMSPDVTNRKNTESFIHSFISLLPTNVKTRSLLHMTKTYYDYVSKQISNSIKYTTNVYTYIHKPVCKY